MNAMPRRSFLQATAATALGASWLPGLARCLANEPQRKRQCILLWMTGGPSQTDTFDMKPGHEHGGEFQEIQTAATGLRFSEHLPKLAKWADRLAVVRSLSTKEGDHGRGTYLVRTGQPPMGPIQYPMVGASLAKHLGDRTAPLPAFVSISPYRAFNQAAFGPGFLGPRYAPLTVGATDNYQQQIAGAGGDNGYAELTVDDLAPPEGVAANNRTGRRELWRSLQSEFLQSHGGAAPAAHDTVYQRAMQLMDSEAAASFDLSQEPAKVRDAYGRGRFGQGCLLARRLVERGVAFSEVSLGAFGGGSLGWDTHRNNFDTVKQLSQQLDAGWSALMSDLQERGLLETTTILWIGEFGRTPKINVGGGRDHFPAAWSCVFAGGGVQGGGAHGSTGEDGVEVREDPVAIGDVLATLCSALGVSPHTQNISEMGRPIRIAEGEPIKDILV